MPPSLHSYYQTNSKIAASLPKLVFRVFESFELLNTKKGAIPFSASNLVVSKKMSDNNVRKIELRAEFLANQQKMSRAQADLNLIRQANSMMAAKIAGKQQERDDLKAEARSFRDANPMTSEATATTDAAKSSNKK